MPSINEKAELFRHQHHREQILLLPNPWDVGSARILASLGFEALATTSAGFAHSLGRPDGGITRDEALNHVREIAAATDLPVSADLERCFADDPDGVAETVAAAITTGAVGCSVEDATGDQGNPIYDFGFAVARVAAAVEAARQAAFSFTLTARAENHLHGRTDLDDTIKRLVAFQDAGADVVYAPGLADRRSVRAVVSAIDVPVNVLGLPVFTADELQEDGVSRVSVGSGMSKTAYASLIEGGRELIRDGTFGYGRPGLRPDLDHLFA